MQVDNSGTERVIQYVSHSLSRVQRRWATIEKEAYAVVYAISKLCPYLYGADFTVYTDHKPLTSLFTKEMRNTKIERCGGKESLKKLIRKWETWLPVKRFRIYARRMFDQECDVR